MKIYDAVNSILSIFNRSTRIPKVGVGYYSDFGITHYPFADVVFLNCVELLTDLVGDVTLTSTNENDPRFVAFRRFFEQYGKAALTRVYQSGYVVIGHTQTGEGATAAHTFHICNKDEFNVHDQSEFTDFTSAIEGMDIYVMRSSTYSVTNKSDRQLLQPFLDFLDNALNASNTVSERLGAFVVASPKNVTQAPAPVVLNEKDKEAMEKEISKEYGALRHQKQVMVLPREMTWQVISLAQLDLKTLDKAKMAVTAICDRIKVPANQVGLIDANSSKSLSNGTELREGDFNKYQSFERLLDQTFIQMARDLHIEVDYTIYNKPTREAIPATPAV